MANKLTIASNNETPSEENIPLIDKVTNLKYSGTSIKCRKCGHSLPVYAAEGFGGILFGLGVNYLSKDTEKNGCKYCK